MSCIIEKQDSEINEFFYISLISRKIMSLSVNFNKTDVRKFTDFFYVEFVERLPWIQHLLRNL